MRKVRYPAVLAVLALLSTVLAGSALPATASPQAAGTQQATGTPHHKKATPTPAKNVRVHRKGIHYTVTWKGVATTWQVTLKVGTRTVKAKVKGSVHKRVFKIRNGKGTPHAVVMGTTVVKTTTTSTQSALAFTGSYSGQASSKVNGSATDIAANGTGSGNLIGAGSITGSGTADQNVQPCPPFVGTGTIKGAKGTIAFSVVKGAKGCGDEGGHNFSLVGYLQVTSATGSLANATGQLRFTGTYNRDAGTFSIKLTGSLKK